LPAVVPAERLHVRRDRDEDLAVEVRPAEEASPLLFHDADDPKRVATDLYRLVEWIGHPEKNPAHIGPEHADGTLVMDVEPHDEAPAVGLSARQARLLLRGPDDLHAFHHLVAVLDVLLGVDGRVDDRLAAELVLERAGFAEIDRRAVAVHE